MKICLVAGSSVAESLVAEIKTADKLVGIDGGTTFLLTHGFVPEVAVGDFDSVSATQKQNFASQIAEIITLPAEKDDTDTQIALLWAVTRYPEAEFVLLGATGGRVDHFLANLFLPFEARFAPFTRQLRLLDEQNAISFYRPGHYAVEKIAGFKYVAFTPLSATKSLTISNAKYTLAPTDIPTPFSYASNEFLADGTPIQFEFATGLVAVIQSADKK